MNEPASEFEPRAGDVILIDHGEGGGLVSKTIRGVTKSPYSHTILALGPDLFTDAFEGATGPFVKREADIERWPLAAGWLDRPTCDLFRLPPGRPTPDPALMLDAVTEYERRAKKIESAPDGIEFDTGAMAGLAILRGLMTLERRADLDPEILESIVKFRRATFKVLNNSDTRLFCSEYVYRVLTDGGSRPQLGDRSFISVDGYRTDESRLLEFDPFGAIAKWIRGAWKEILGFAERVLALPSEGLEIGDVLARIRDAYDDPAPDPVLERANFVAPTDFEVDRIHVATRTPQTKAWGPPRPRPWANNGG